MLLLLRPAHTATDPLQWLLLATVSFVVSAWIFGTGAWALEGADLVTLRTETIQTFYHGFDGYMQYAFPDDELKPVTCKPLTRDRENPSHIEVNDVLGNYSLTLIDSLSTLAIIASSQEAEALGRRPLIDFQNGVESLVHLYGDGSRGPSGVGTRSRGFDLDSKVQVFETVIRGVGGLLSAHLFAVGDLPILGYSPARSTSGIQWSNGFVYNGQLLRLATDLTNRLLPAFHTETGLPYPRVNLRYGASFYQGAMVDDDSTGQCDNDSDEAAEITETCSAGAGSLVLELSTLSSLTGNPEYEFLAKRAFLAVWQRRSPLGLIGSGIDAENGQWVHPVTGIGAGVDSFFEYAFKSHILLSGADSSNTTIDELAFLGIWQEAHASIKRHLYRGSSYQHPHYVQGDINTGAARAFWIDSLSAYYPGLLTLAGELEEAIETHLLWAALWSKYSALPERWSTASGDIDQGLNWWGGRPEFIESTWYLYRATQDPWYIYVGEMVLHDIQRRCWTSCGWAGLEDVRTGQLKDRMESFFLGETVKYLFLLFDPMHPLNRLDAPYVFTTEGHPLVIRQKRPVHNPKPQLHVSSSTDRLPAPTCPVSAPSLPLTVSRITARDDFFHAAALARLNLTFGSGSDVARGSIVLGAEHDQQRSVLAGHPFYPRNIPKTFIPSEGFSSKMIQRTSFDLSFPSSTDVPLAPLMVQRINEGVLVHSVNGLKMSMTRESTVDAELGRIDAFRIHSIGQVSLGRDEKVLISRDLVANLNPTDPFFTRHREIASVDVVLDLGLSAPSVEQRLSSSLFPSGFSSASLLNVGNGNNKALTGNFLDSLIANLASTISNNPQLNAFLYGTPAHSKPNMEGRIPLDASVATGIGAGPLPDVADVPLSGDAPPLWTSVFIADELCTTKLSRDIPRSYQVIVIRRGGCSFSQKLRRIPSFTPTRTSLQLVVIVSDPNKESMPSPIRPHLDEFQRTPGGLLRSNNIPLVMLDGGNETLDLLRKAKGVGLRRRYRYESQELRISNLIII